MAQWSRVRMALPEDRSELSSTHVRQLTMPVTPGNSLSLASVGSFTHEHMTTHKHTYTWLKIKLSLQRELQLNIISIKKVAFGAGCAGTCLYSQPLRGCEFEASLVCSELQASPGYIVSPCHKQTNKQEVGVRVHVVLQLQLSACPVCPRPWVQPIVHALGYTCIPLHKHTRYKDDLH